MPQGIETTEIRVETYRKRTGLSREKLVARLPAAARITAQQLYRIELGKSSTQLSTAFALADLFTDLLGEKVTIDDLFPLPGVKEATA